MSNNDPFLYQRTSFVRAVKIKAVRPTNIFTKLREVFSNSDARIYFELEQDSDTFSFKSSDFVECTVTPKAGHYLVNHINDNGEIEYVHCLIPEVFETYFVPAKENNNV